ncbi:MAG: helix-turn-helix domain-containing protein [archaeon]|jgi:sugar-specific transcriptional regulator TrmB
MENIETKGITTSNITASYFEDIGFKKKYANVYLALLKFGHMGIPDIVKKTGVQRSYLYDILDELIEKGIVGSYVKNNTKIFFADDPEKVLKIINKKEENIKNFKKEYTDILPTLISISSKNEKDELFSYEGKKGIKNIYDDILKEGKDFVCFAGTGFPDDFYKDFVKTFNIRCKKKGIKYKLIFSDALKSRGPLEVHKDVCEIKYLPKEYNYSFAMHVYGDKVSIIIWQSQMGIVIKSKNAANGFADYFEMIWKIAKE